MFGAVYYLSDDALAELCRNLRSGVLRPDALFIVNNLNHARRMIIEGSGFRLRTTQCHFRPRYRFETVMNLTLALSFLRAVVEHREDASVRAFVQTTEHTPLKWLHSRTGWQSVVLSKLLSVAWVLASIIPESLPLYRLMTLLGKESMEVFAFENHGD
jgi:hypothetical protein